MTLSFNLKYKKAIKHKCFICHSSQISGNPSFPLDSSIDTELLGANIPNSGHLYW